MSMDRSTGAERERVVQQERAAARGRVQAARDQEIATRVEKRAEKQRRTDEDARDRQARSRARVADSDGAAAPTTNGPVEREGQSAHHVGG